MTTILTKQMKNSLVIASVVTLLLSPIMIMLATFSTNATGHTMINSILFLVIICSIPYFPILFLYEDNLQLRVLSFAGPVVLWVLVILGYLLLNQKI